MRSPGSLPRLAWLLGALSLVLATVALALLIATRDTQLPPHWGFRGFALVLGVPFALVGALVASRRPQNALGWLLVGEGLLAATQGLVYECAVFTLVARPGSLPGGELFGWVDNWLWVVGMGTFGSLVLLLFPNGHPPTPRWRPVVWLGLWGPAVGASGLFTPVKNSLQGVVDRYFKEAHDATRALMRFEERIHPVAETLNSERMATRFLGEVAGAL